MLNTDPGFGFIGFLITLAGIAFMSVAVYSMVLSEHKNDGNPLTQTVGSGGSAIKDAENVKRLIEQNNVQSLQGAEDLLK